uniref:Uncharacterized protein n=1 Tax=Oncorhynchus mykiss TaxID=8022 RepID=A0A8K9V031_ONCMY
MDRDLLRKTLSHHGQSLFTHLKCEQRDKSSSIGFSKASYQRKCGGEDNALVEQFIARKADILFAPSWKSSATVEDPYAIMPPLEQFMAVSFEERRNLLYMEDFGFFVTLICMAGGLERDIEDGKALCPLRAIMMICYLIRGECTLH